MPEFLSNYDPTSQKFVEMLRAGSFLLSCEKLKDPNFDSTIVLICHHEDEGSYGLIVNRFATMPLTEIFNGLGSVDVRHKVYMGGPVREEELQVLHVTDTPAPKAYRIAPRVYLGGEWPDLTERLHEDNPGFLLFLGYAGWGREQLNAEIMAGAWEVYNADVQKVLLAPPQDLVGGPDKLREFLRSITV